MTADKRVTDARLVEIAREGGLSRAEARAMAAEVIALRAEVERVKAEMLSAAVWGPRWSP